MIISSATAGSEWFLNGIANLQQQQTQTEREISSGYQIADAADSPSQAAQLVALGSSLSSAQTYQANLIRVQAEASGADSALGSGISLLDRARTLAAQAANTTLSPANLQSISTEIQGIQQQLVSISNTTVEGRNIFGGNNDQSAPYLFDPTTGTAVSQTTPTSSRVIVDPGGQPVYQGLTAQYIFDPTDATGTSTGDSTFAALQSLQTALQTNSPSGITAALTLLQNASAYLNQQQSYYGTSEQRLTSEQTNTANQITTLGTTIGDIRDTNVPQAASDLTREITSQSAAYAAEAEISKKSLFDYLG